MILNEDEAARLLRHLAAEEDLADENDRVSAAVDRVVVGGLLGSGLRCSEFCRLRLSDLSLSVAAPRLTVRGGDGRVVHIARDLAKLMQAYVAKWRPILASHASAARSDAFILNERGKPYDRTALYRRVVRVLTAAGFGEQASVQLLRHTYGYLAYVRTGGNLLFVQRQLGHAHPGITAVYARLVPEDDAALAELAAAGRSAARPPPRSNQPSRRARPAQRPAARSAPRNAKE